MSSATADLWRSKSLFWMHVLTIHKRTAECRPAARRGYRAEQAASVPRVVCDSRFLPCDALPCFCSVSALRQPAHGLHFVVSVLVLAQEIVTPSCVTQGFYTIRFLYNPWCSASIRLLWSGGKRIRCSAKSAPLFLHLYITDQNYCW